MKKVTFICLIFFIALFFLTGNAFAAPEYGGTINSSYAVMLIDADSGNVLYEQNADEQIRPASTTKILTTLITLENSSLDDVVTIGPEGDWSNKSNSFSKLGTRNGEKIKMKDLLYGMMLASGDDAADALAVHIGGSIEGFVGMMNSKAQELGMDSSSFANPGGVDNDNHFITVRDMSKLVLYAMKNQKFKDIVKTASYDIPATNKTSAKTVPNTNSLLDSTNKFYYQYATGVKTGQTPKAGDCLVSSATRDGMNLICLFYGLKYTDDRWTVSKNLFEYGFNNFETTDLSEILANVNPVQVQVENWAASDTGEGLLGFKKPDTGSAYVTLDKTVIEGILNGTDSVVATPTYSKDTPLQAPISEGDILGTITYTSNATGEVIYTGDLIASRDVAESGGATVTNGTTAVATLPPTLPVKVVTSQDNGGIWFWLLIPAGLITFLVIRILTVRKSRSRFKKRRPHYSYRIR